MTARLRICYAAPGHALLATSGTTRNVLSLAGALSASADVTVAFRSLRQRVACGFDVVAIEPAQGTQGVDDEGGRGLDPLSHLAYLRTVRRWAAERAASFDLVLEKGWRLSGLLAAAFRRHGVPGVLVENDARHWSDRIDGPRAALKYVLHHAAQAAAGCYSRRAGAVIAETEELKAALVAHRRIPAGRIEVVGLGVDHDLFRPHGRDEVRTALGICADAMIWLYVGGLDKYHDLGPLLEAMASAPRPGPELHVVGEGVDRPRHEERARAAGLPVVFHGRIPHREVPRFIAAADLCLAPYQPAAFHGGTITFSTLKIPEYMACGRPVVSVPSGSISRLIEPGVTGFLLPNEVGPWSVFLNDYPGRDRLEEMGRAAVKAARPITWERTAAGYLEVGRRLAT